MNKGYFKNKLLELKKETLGAIERSKDSSKPVELDQTMVGRLSRMDAMQQQEMALAAKRRREQLIYQIEDALKRIESGDYGYCIMFDEEIAEKRLDLDPVILTCIKCAQ
jgi:DnaK suppressor protein